MKIAYSVIVGVALLALPVFGARSGDSEVAPNLGSSGESPQIISPFELMLGHLPDNEESRQEVQVVDVMRLRDGFGITRPGDDATSDEVFEHVIEMLEQSFNILGTQITRHLGTRGTDLWLSGLRGIDTNETTYDSLGFDARSIDQIGAFGDHTYGREILLGSFDPKTTSDHLAACDDCLPHDVVSHSEVDYYAWGEDFKQSLHLRLAKPAFDDLGRGGRILIKDGLAAWTLSNELMEQIIDASAGLQPSLADDPAYLLAAELLWKYGAVNAKFVGVNLSAGAAPVHVQEAWDNGLTRNTTIEEVEKQLAEAHLLLPFEVAAAGIAFPSEPGGVPPTYVVLVHTSEKEAEENSERLRQRIESDTRLYGSVVGRPALSDGGTTTTWGEYFNNYEVWTEGTAVVLKVTAGQRGGNLVNQLVWDLGSPFLVHVLIVTE
ncbi:MAG: hypothetical protein O3B95_06775 [Chloroflexi bacterium]|nr:hypothetical protein [Chloroflexota bacterium]